MHNFTFTVPKRFGMILMTVYILHRSTEYPISALETLTQLTPAPRSTWTANRFLVDADGNSLASLTLPPDPLS
jgi:hypothetical protein